MLKVPSALCGTVFYRAVYTCACGLGANSSDSNNTSTCNVGLVQVQACLARGVMITSRHKLVRAALPIYNFVPESIITLLCSRANHGTRGRGYTRLPECVLSHFRPGRLPGSLTTVACCSSAAEFVCFRTLGKPNSCMLACTQIIIICPTKYKGTPRQLATA